MDQSSNNLKTALQRRRGRGLDISILVGGADPIDSTKPIDGLKDHLSEEDKEDEKESDLAPEVKDEAPSEKDGELGDMNAMHEALAGGSKSLTLTQRAHAEHMKKLKGKEKDGEPGFR